MYKSISDYYDMIFQPDSGQVDFVIENCGSGINLLEAGCGTGSLAGLLAKKKYIVEAVDLDDSMIDAAKRKFSKEENLSFHVLNILDCGQTFAGKHFNTIVSFGNTIVHLSGIEELRIFFSGCRKIISDDGKLLLQIINYDKVLTGALKSLPVIENSDIVFKRFYEIQNNSVIFNSELVLKKNMKLIKNSVIHYPLQKDEIAGLLFLNGFSSVEFYGSFSKDPWAQSSMLTVVSAGA